MLHVLGSLRRGVVAPVLVATMAATLAVPSLARAQDLPAASPPILITSLGQRSEEHTSELQSLMRISYAVFCLKKKTKNTNNHTNNNSKQRDLHDQSKNEYST